MLRLNIGSGPKIKHLEGFVNIDCLDDADVRIDLENAMLPYTDDSVDEIQAHQVFEHIRNLIPLMNELRRVLKPEGKLICSVPTVNNHLMCFSDPTHVRYFTKLSWAYYAKDTHLYETVGKSYGIHGWSDVQQELQNGWNLVAEMRK